jgi:hypothetical protein
LRGSRPIPRAAAGHDAHRADRKPAKEKDTMKLYRVTGIAKSDQGTTAGHHAHPLASGISTRQAADRIVAELASQGAINLDVQAYTENDEVADAA